MNLAAKILDHDAGQRQGHESIQSQLGADTPHLDQGRDRKHDRISRIHDSRPQQHANGVQVIGRAGHNISRSCFLIERVRERFQMAEQIVSQVIFDVARNSNDQPARQKLENTFGQNNRHQQQRIKQQLVPIDAVVQSVHRPLDYLGK